MIHGTEKPDTLKGRSELLDELQALRARLNDYLLFWREKERCKKSVQDWMREQGQQGHLRQNNQAPDWFAYEAAELALAAAHEKLVTE